MSERGVFQVTFRSLWMTVAIGLLLVLLALFAEPLRAQKVQESFKDKFNIAEETGGVAIALRRGQERCHRLERLWQDRELVADRPDEVNCDAITAGNRPASPARSAGTACRRRRPRRTPARAPCPDPRAPAAARCPW